MDKKRKRNQKLDEFHFVFYLETLTAIELSKQIVAQDLKNINTHS
jgi:hypothetical protein